MKLILSINPNSAVNRDAEYIVGQILIAGVWHYLRRDIGGKITRLWLEKKIKVYKAVEIDIGTHSGIAKLLSQAVVFSDTEDGSAYWVDIVNELIRREYDSV